ncbi:hypothetical protein TRICI_006561 [Trichomonascus ciferrii]|uniref:N-acetyltransferase domain-containing protein n=1 Tax=Trichomonascus ciferrii TaxID=44093 RepID=A0A642UGB0_9ASCO|nr:hypothetical protein TRICI_006561 [Trichomonascus ciferrii]
MEAKESEDAEINVEKLEQGIRMPLEDPSIAMYWVLVDEEDVPVGNVSVTKEWSDWNAGYYWWIQTIFIRQEYRGLGCVKILVSILEKEMKEQGGLELRLYVHRDNKRARRAYEKVNFELSRYEMMALVPANP